MSWFGVVVCELGQCVFSGLGLGRLFFFFLYMCFGGRLSYIMLGSSGVPVESVSASGNFEVGGPDRKAVGFSKDSCGKFSWLCCIWQVSVYWS